MNERRSEGFLELAGRRYSLRCYDRGRAVPRETLERCLEAARLAPSACNSQPWRFLVVDRDPLREQLGKAAFGGIYRMNSFARQAPVLVAVVRDRARYAARLGGTLRGIEYSLVDIGIAVEHFVLQAAEEGIGTCWLGWFSERGVKRVLGLGRRERVDMMICAGYPPPGYQPREKIRKAPGEMRSFLEA